MDADRVFEKQHEITIKDFVKSFGWEEFRKYETGVLCGLFRNYHDKDIILAPGGGAVAHNQGENYRAENVNLLRSLGQLVYILPTESLEESARILVERMNNDVKSANQRPSLTQTNSQYCEMLNVLRERDELYREAAHHTFYTRDMTSAQAAWCINDLVK